jgi:LysR family glycine cleavage system transcriptional activator
MTRIPSATSLQAFAIAAEKLSFIEASQELNLSAGAISRQIQNLEQHLGCRLFTRHHKRVELTPDGRDYLAEIAAPLERIAAATARLRGEAQRGALSICAYPTFALRWLIPRWARFYDRHPEIDIRLTTSLAPVDFRHDDYDLAMRVMADDECPVGLAAHKLIDIETFPVCSPRLAAQLASPSDLNRQVLLHGAPRPTDWRRWLETAGVTDVDAGRGMRFESLNLAIQAAIEGVGVVIGIEALIHDDLASGRLVRPFAVTRRSHRPFQLTYPAAKADLPRLAPFRDWLLEEAAAIR